MDDKILRRRQSKGRSKNGCITCRSRHIKCDEARPTCRRCIDAGQQCNWRPSTASEANVPAKPAKTIISLHTPSLLGNSELEESIFHRFATDYGPKFGQLYDEIFWIKSVLPAARAHDSIFSAVLAMATLYTQSPGDELLHATTIVQKRYRDATEWYSRSVNTMMRRTIVGHSATDLSVMLLTTVLYFYIEMRQGHYTNCHNLIRIAFNIVHGAQSKLWKSGNSVILAVILQSLQTSTNLMIDASCVPVETRRSVIALGLKLAADLAASEPTLLRLELHSLLYDVHDALDGIEKTYAESSCMVLLKGQCIPSIKFSNDLGSIQSVNASEKNKSELDQRLRNWYLRLLRYESTLPFRSPDRSYLHRMKILFMQFDAQLQIHRGHGYRHGQVAEFHLLRLLSMLEAETLFASNASEGTPNWLAESTIIPLCLFLGWYWRQESVLARISKATEALLKRSNNYLLRKVLVYLGELVRSDSNQGTALELRIFGRKPTILRGWHCYILSCYLT